MVDTAVPAATPSSLTHSVCSLAIGANRHALSRRSSRPSLMGHGETTSPKLHSMGTVPPFQGLARPRAAAVRTAASPVIAEW